MKRRHFLTACVLSSLSATAHAAETYRVNAAPSPVRPAASGKPQPPVNGQIQPQILVAIKILDGVPVAKLQQLDRFDQQFTIFKNAQEAQAFLDSLLKNEKGAGPDKAVLSLAEPTLITVAGRPARLNLANAVDLNVIPTIVGDTIHAEVRCEVQRHRPRPSPPAPGKSDGGVFKEGITTAVDLKNGETAMLSGLPAENSKNEPVVCLKFIHVEIVQPPDAASAPAPGKTAVGRAKRRHLR